jgi:hypothetical protein
MGARTATVLMVGLADEAKVSFAQDKKSPVTCVTGQFFQFQS